MERCQASAGMPLSPFKSALLALAIGVVIAGATALAGATFGIGEAAGPSFVRVLANSEIDLCPNAEACAAGSAPTWPPAVGAILFAAQPATWLVAVGAGILVEIAEDGHTVLGRADTGCGGDSLYYPGAGDLAYLACGAAATGFEIVVWNLSSRSVQSTVTIPQWCGGGLAFDGPLRTAACVALSATGSTSVLTLSMQNLTVTGEVPYGNSTPQSLLFDRSAGAYVGYLWGAAKLIVVDPSTGVALRTATMPGDPVGIQLDASGTELLVATEPQLTLGNREPLSLSVVNSTTLTVETTLPVENQGASPEACSLFLDPHSRIVYLLTWDGTFAANTSSLTVVDASDLSGLTLGSTDFDTSRAAFLSGTHTSGMRSVVELTNVSIGVSNSPPFSSVPVLGEAFPLGIGAGAGVAFAVAARLLARKAAVTMAGDRVLP